MRTIISFFLIWAACFFSGCNRSTSKGDFEQIVKAVLRQKSLETYYSHYWKNNILINCKTSDSVGLNWRDESFEVKIEEGKSIYYNIKDQQGKQLLIEITGLEIHQNEADLNLKIPQEGILGNFKLIKNEEWIVTENKVVEL